MECGVFFAYLSLILSEEWYLDFSEAYEILEQDVDAESHKGDEEDHIDVSFDVEIFLRFQLSDALYKDAQ